MKSGETVGANGIVGSYADMLCINAKGNNDWIEGNGGVGLTFKADLGALLGARATNERTYTCAA